MSRVLASSRLSAFALCVTFAACGGGSTTSAAGSALPTVAPTVGPHTTGVHLQISIPSPGTSTRGRLRPHYVSPGTSTITVSVNGGVPQTFPAGNGTSCSPPPTQPGSCTVYDIVAPTGTDTFAVALYDVANHLLSSGSVTSTIVQNIANTVSVVFDGVPATLTLGLTNPSPPAGTAGTSLVNLALLDAAGYSIVGSPGTLPDVMVSDSDSSGTTTLFTATDATCSVAVGPSSTTVIATQAGPRTAKSSYTPVCLTYTGGPLGGGATISAAVSGGPSSSVHFAPSAASAITGVWAIRTAGNVVALERLDPSLNVVTAIGGSNTGFTGGETGVGADAVGNVYVVSAQRSPYTYDVRRFPANGGGNIGPTAVTTFNLPNQNGTLSGPAVDSDGYGYFVANGNTCWMYRVLLAPGTQTPQTVFNCTGYPQPGAVRIAGTSQLFVAFAAYGHTGDVYGHSTIAQFVRNADGTVAQVSRANFRGGGAAFDIDPRGDLVVTIDEFSTATQSGIALIPPSAFTADGGQYDQQVYAYRGVYGSPVLDDAGNLYIVSFNNGVRQAQVIPPGQTTPNATSTSVPSIWTRARTAPGP